MATVSIGVFLPTMGERGESLPPVAAAARHAEALGFESAWVVDQLVAGTGVPFVESTVALATAAGATERIGLAYGVMIVPLRQVAWAAKQIASLQIVSGGRLILGVGVGGDRHDRSWAAAGVPRRERGARLDDALELLPGLIAGEAVTVGDDLVQLAPGAAVPPIVVGGMADAALDRVVRSGAGWFSLPLPPDDLAPTIEDLRRGAGVAGRPAPSITASAMAAIEGDPALPDAAGLHRRLTDPDGMFGVPSEAVPTMLLHGGPDDVAARFAGLAAIGAERVVVTLAAGDWFRQAELLAEAAARFRAGADAAAGTAP